MVLFCRHPDGIRIFNWKKLKENLIVFLKHHSQHLEPTPMNQSDNYIPSPLKLSFLRICTVVVSLAISTQATGDTVAIIGGIDLTDTDPAYAALVNCFYPTKFQSEQISFLSQLSCWITVNRNCGEVRDLD